MAGIITGWLRPPTIPEKGIPPKEIQRLIADPEKQTWSEGGRLCDKCRARISFKDLYGQYEGNLFFIKGYLCPGCGHKTCEIKALSGNLPYDWRRIS